MAVGGTAFTLRKYCCYVVAAVREYQISLTKQLQSVDEVICSTALNDSKIRQSFDVVLSFDGIFANRCEIKRGNYYDHVSDRVKHKVRPGEFKFKWEPQADVVGRKAVALHPGASNPNRRWPDESWRKLAYGLLDRQFHVVWLGTKDEFGFNVDDFMCSKVSDVTEDLEWQVRALAGCHYFIGNDSGFAHAAGLLGIPGVVLFSATWPPDVIGHYPQLRAVEVFGGLQPSRSLVANDPAALKCLEEITVDQVLEVAGFNAIDCTVGTFKEIPAMQHKLAVISDCKQGDLFARFLSQSFEVHTLDNIPHEGSDFVALIEVRGGRCRVRTRFGNANLDISNLESAQRGIRELLIG